jgi:hypothetical protein
MESSMERGSGFNGKEIVGIAAAGAVALGGIVTALARSNQRNSGLANVTSTLDELKGTVADNADSGRQATGVLLRRLVEAYPGLRRDLSSALAQAASELESRTSQAGDAISSRAPEPLVEGLVERATSLGLRAADIVDQLPPEDVKTRVTELLSNDGSSNSTRVRDSVVSIAVLAIVSVLAYVVLMSPERREAIKDALCRLVESAQLFSDDFRGYEDEM